MHHDQITIGETAGRKERPFAQAVPDRLHHAFILGQTGTGKSTLLQNLVLQDIQAGRGICLIDPHGDFAEAVVNEAGDVCRYWNAADPTCPLGYNPLTAVSAPYRPLVASGLIETLKQQWSDAWGPRMEHLLRYALLALLAQPSASVADIMPLFLDAGFRNRVIANLDDEQVRSFWQVEYEALKYKGSADGVASIANKLGAFLAHSVVRQSVCEPKEPIRFRQIMDEGQVLIVNLAKGRLGADISNVLGGLVVTGIANAAYSRANVSAEERRPFFLYIDEWHHFTTEAFASMLPELRKYGVGLIAANQHTTQLGKPVLEAVLGNAGTLFSFRLGATDAEVIARQLGGDIPKPKDLIGLANYEMFVGMMVEGRQSRAFSAKTLPIPTASRAASPRQFGDKSFNGNSLTH